MERCWSGIDALELVHGPEAADAGVEVASAVVVEAEVLVPLFAGVEVDVVGRAGRQVVQEVAEGVIVVTIGDCAGLVGQVANAAEAVVAVVVDCALYHTHRGFRKPIGFFPARVAGWRAIARREKGG